MCDEDMTNDERSPEIPIAENLLFGSWIEDLDDLAPYRS